ncbi:hypothetical protein RCH17_002667 [Arthrobacter sp. MP_M7]|nr:hypothetical protein [Arthrobacter sp. MP_M4]MEC5203851.1 hypothetical protein [Arthrobacter sp. MP_M7]
MLLTTLFTVNAHSGVKAVPPLLESGVLLAFGLIEGSSHGWWTPAASLTVLGMTWPVTAPISAAPVSLLTGAGFLTLFVLWERHRARIGRSVIPDLELFKTGTFRWKTLRPWSRRPSRSLVHDLFGKEDQAAMTLIDLPARGLPLRGGARSVPPVELRWSFPERVVYSGPETHGRWDGPAAIISAGRWPAKGTKRRCGPCLH